MELGGMLFEVVKCLWDPLTRQIGHLTDLKKSYEELIGKTKNLYEKRDDIKEQINRHRQKEGKIPTRECKGWLSDVEKIEEKVDTIKEDYNKCLKGWPCRVGSRMKLGGRIVDTIKRITTLQENFKFDSSSLIDEVPKVERRQLPHVKFQKPIDRTLKEILLYIKDAKIGIIGIHGIGGVGKTTIMSSLNNLPEIESMFDIVIWVSVSKDWSLRNVQNVVARRLSLDLKNEELDGKLSKALEDMKYLLLLDDVWEKIELDKVGIPYPNEDNGCKVVLTTRSLVVCNQMETDKEISVEILSKDDAWELFCMIAKVPNSEEIQLIARDIVKKCGDLPLVINKVGVALRKVDDIGVWRSFLQDFQSSSTFHIDELDLEEYVFKPLKASYDRLKDSYTKKCFLYCALYPEDHEIKIAQLLEYWWAEGLISGEKSFAEALYKGKQILKTLTDASLVERSARQNCVKMHKVYHDIALTITSNPKEEESCKFLVRAGFSTAKTPKEEEWEDAERISLMYNKLNKLPESPKCPKLTTLLLQVNPSLKTIPESFFENMGELRVLDLSGTSIEHLPSSLCNLVNLQGLYLNACNKLKALPTGVRELKKLKVLHVTVSTLPHEIGQLTRLRSLKVSDPNEDEEEPCEIMIHGGVISRLSLLEELSIVNVRMLDGNQFEKCVEIVTKELSGLRNLSSLIYFFGKMENLQHFVQNNSSWRNLHLRTFFFMVGYPDQFDFMAGYRSYTEFVESPFKMYSRHLAYEGDGDGDGSIIPLEIMDVLRHADRFSFGRNTKVQKLSEFGVQNMLGLKYCNVYRCGAIESMIDGDILEMAAFPNLETLFLTKIQNLMTIWKGSIKVGSFTSLIELVVIDCPNIKSLFSSSMMQQLSNLERLYLKRCSQMEVIFGELKEEKDISKGGGGSGGGGDGVDGGDGNSSSGGGGDVMVVMAAVAVVAVAVAIVVMATVAVGMVYFQN